MLKIQNKHMDVGGLFARKKIANYMFDIVVSCIQDTMVTIMSITFTRNTIK